jgi:hypothetical protein
LGGVSPRRLAAASPGAATPLFPDPERFADLGLSDELLRAVADSGYGEPTPIQQGVILSVLMGRDIVGIAQTAPARPPASSCR